MTYTPTFDGPDCPETIDTHLMSLEFEPRPRNPRDLVPRLGWLTGRIAVSGGLEHAEWPLADRLAEWEAAGVTHYVAVHEEFRLKNRIEAISSIRVTHIGVDDDLRPKDGAWFEAVAAAVARILADPEAKVVITCHLGVNRGPSAALAALLSRGWSLLPALRAIRDARPIANSVYAPSAARWWALREGGDERDADAAELEVLAWFDRNPLEAGHVIGDILWGR